jgi:hypothetical protein
VDGRDGHDPEKASSRRQRLGKWVAGVVGTIVLAAIVAFSSGLGTKAAEDIGEDEGAPVSYSVEEQSVACFSGTYRPADHVQEVLDGIAPAEWERLEEGSGAAPVDRDLVRVAIQGESERKVTLTGIEFDADRLTRPDGAAFYRPCGGPTVGRVLVVDLDAEPPQVTESSAEVDGMPGRAKPIRFPWTVSLTDPLLLEIIGTSDRCYCTWSAEITWVSGSKQGVISIDDGGKGFTVVNSNGLDSYGVGPDGAWVATN